MDRELAKMSAEELTALRAPVNIYPHERLTTPTSLVPDELFGTKVLSTTILQLYATMRMNNGVGMAHNQINVGDHPSLQIITIQVPEKSPWVLINPVLITESGEFEFEEGCLSFPTFFIKKTRAEEVRIAYRDFDGNHIDGTFTGFTATVLQHEMEHLRGETFITGLSPLKQQRARKKVMSWVRKNKLPK